MSVILPLRGGAPWLHQQLCGLQAQTYRGPWQLLVADNGCAPAVVDLLGSWRNRLPLEMVDATSRRGINAARNRAVAAADGDLLAFCDGDDVVEPGWLSAMVDAAEHADVIGGRLDEESLNGGVEGPARPRMPVEHLPIALGFLPFAVGANLAVWAHVLHELGGFDERFRGGHDDVELSFRAQLAGKHLGFAPDAVVAYRHRACGLELFRQFRGYGRFEPLLYAQYRDCGMPRPPAAEVARRWVRLLLGAPLVLAAPPGRSPEARGDWLVRAGFTIGRLRGALATRVPYL